MQFKIIYYIYAYLFLTLMIYGSRKVLVSSPPRNYAVMMDAGSTGTRLFIYTWPIIWSNSGSLPPLEVLKDDKNQSLIFKIKNGLTNDKQLLEQNMTNLLNFARSHIPLKVQDQTYVYVFATGGLRSKQAEIQTEVYDLIYNYVKDRYNFKFDRKNFRTISGTEEAIYGWITVNYLLHRFGNDETGRSLDTYGMLDMGGATLQIALEVFDRNNADDIETLSNLGGNRTYRVYAHSFPNYGAHVLHGKYLEHLVRTYTKENPDFRSDRTPPIPDPCMYPGHFNHEGMNVSFRGAGDFEACRRSIYLIFNQTVNCHPQPCTIENVQIPLVKWNRTKFYGIANFAHAFEGMNPGPVYDYAKLSLSSKELCARPWSAIIDHLNSKYDNKSEEYNSTMRLQRLQCFKASYVIEFLHNGLHIPMSYKLFHPTIHLNGTEVQWSLGAMLKIISDSKTRSDEKAENTEFSMTILSIVLSTIVLILIISSFVYIFYRIRRRQLGSSTP